MRRHILGFILTIRPRCGISSMVNSPIQVPDKSIGFMGDVNGHGLGLGACNRCACDPAVRLVFAVKTFRSCFCKSFKTLSPSLAMTAATAAVMTFDASNALAAASRSAALAISFSCAGVHLIASSIVNRHLKARSAIHCSKLTLPSLVACAPASPDGDSTIGRKNPHSPFHRVPQAC